MTHGEWTFEDTIRNVKHVSWMWPDGIHTIKELRSLEPGRRDYESPCPCGCGTTVEELL
jgi:hypothetical protein